MALSLAWLMLLANPCHAHQQGNLLDKHWNLHNHKGKLPGIDAVCCQCTMQKLCAWQGCAHLGQGCTPHSLVLNGTLLPQ